MNCEFDFAGFRDIGTASEDVVCSVDGDRNNGQSEFDGEGICSTSECVHVSVESACAFGEDYNGHASGEPFFCGFHCVSDCGRR